MTKETQESASRSTRADYGPYPRGSRTFVYEEFSSLLLTLQGYLWLLPLPPGLHLLLGAGVLIGYEESASAWWNDEGLERPGWLDD